MDINNNIFEIVKVYREFWLIDPESYQREYHSRDGKPLTAGYYVVSWPEHILVRQFDENALFQGPFRFRKGAQAAAHWMQQEKHNRQVDSIHIHKLVGAINLFTYSCLKQLNSAITHSQFDASRLGLG